MNGRWSDEGGPTYQAGSTRASLTHTLSLSLARDNHGDGDGQPDTVVEVSTLHLISSSSLPPHSPSLFPREASQSHSSSYCHHPSLSKSSNVVLAPLGDLINFPVSNRGRPDLKTPSSRPAPIFREKWKKKEKRVVSEDGAVTPTPNHMSLPYPQRLRKDRQKGDRARLLPCLALPCLALRVQ
jgi:hypothetical protein